MSHYSDSTCQIKTRDSLVAALEEQGWKVQVHDTPQHLFGYHGDVRPETAHVIIRREHIGSASNDVGFLRQPDGTWKAIISEYDARQRGFTTTWLQKLTSLAALHAGIAEAKKNPLYRGWKVERRTDVKGRLQVALVEP